MSAALNYEPGSYRDREGRVFYDEQGRVCRGLSERALEDWKFVSRAPFFQRAMNDGRIVRSIEAPAAESVSSGWAGVLRHDRVPFVSYPFEWSFGMLRDAALLHLDLLDEALAEDVTLKDGTAYNLQFVGPRPVFVDVGSFERLTPGRPWAGYRQFCQTFLYPLFLQAYRNVPFHPWLRGRLEGITPGECRSLMSFRDFFRRGVPSHVFLHAWLESRKALADVDSTRTLSSAGFSKDMIRRNVAGLKKIVGRLKWSPAESAWSRYAADNSYSSADAGAKERFVREAAGSRRWKLAWDLGANTGAFSRIVAGHADLVVALDGDHLAVERLYQSARSQPSSGPVPILPLVADLADQFAGLGWRGAERKALVDRGRPDLVVCLAIVHHLVIGAGVPLGELLDWLAGLTSGLVIEFVDKADPMVRQMLRERRDIYPEYEPATFERLLTERFEIVRQERLSSGTRTLYFATVRGPR